MSPKGKLKIIPLGGVEEIGKNIYVLEYADDIVILDCGSIFPKEDMLGIDLVIPDVTYLQRNRDKIRGILVTHGHRRDPLCGQAAGRRGADLRHAADAGVDRAQAQGAQSHAQRRAAHHCSRFVGKDRRV